MADFESDELFKSVYVAIDCSIVPSSRNYKLYPSVYVINCIEKMVKFIIETIQFLIRIFLIVIKFRISQLASIRKSP